VRTEIFATPASCGLLNYRRRPAPRSQGCEVRASSVVLDTGGVDKFPRGGSALSICEVRVNINPSPKSTRNRGKVVS
jgi:hypothetical protein